MSQKKAKFNIVDIIVILVLIAGIAFIGVRMFGGQDSDTPAAEPYQITFRVDCVPQEVADSLQRGCAVEETDGRMNLGKLIDFTVDESVCYTTDSKGQILQSAKPGFVSVTLLCEADGIERATGLLVGKDVLNIGSTVTVCFGMTELQVLTLGIAK